MTKKNLQKMGYLFLIFLIIFAAVGCSKSNTPADEQDPPAADEPVYGGTIRIITNAGPTSLGHPTDGGVSAYSSRYPAVESMLAVSSERGHEGVLAKEWNEDIENLKITFKLHEGIKFHDGSELTSEVVKWNFDFAIEKAALRYANFIESIETPDKYTIVFNLNDWHNQITTEWGVRQIFSQEAFEKNGEDWTHTNVVGTGPFKLKEFIRDTKSVWVKNEDYWQEGLPYLDQVEIYFIPDTATAAAMMEAGEAEIWLAADGLNMKNLEDKGFTRQTGWAGMQYHLLPNTVDPASPFVDKRVREALEYALDKEAIVSALGYGYTEVIDTLAPKSDWGGIYPNARKYDPEKAKALLAEAGYANGFDISLIAQAGAGGRNELAETVAGYLKEVGINVTLDIADAGRYFGEVWFGNWKDLALGIGGTDTTFLTAVQRWWGRNGVYQGGFKRPEALLELSDKSLLAKTVEEQKALTEQMVHYIADEALIIPIQNAPAGFMHNGKVHTDYMSQGYSRWRFDTMWLQQQ